MCADAGRALPGAGLDDPRAGEQVEILMPGHAGRGPNASLPGGQHGMGMGQARRAAQDAQVLTDQRLQAATVERRQGGTGFVGNPAGG